MFGSKICIPVNCPSKLTTSTHRCPSYVTTILILLQSPCFGSKLPKRIIGALTHNWKFEGGKLTRFKLWRNSTGKWSILASASLRSIVSSASNECSCPCIIYSKYKLNTVTVSLCGPSIARFSNVVSYKCACKNSCVGKTKLHNAVRLLTVRINNGSLICPCQKEL